MIPDRTTRFYSSLTTELGRRSSRAVASHLSPLEVGLRRFLEERLGSPPGRDGTLLAPPVFEATFNWTEHTKTMDELAGDLLDPELVRAMDAAEADPFKRTWRPYTHQVAAWETLRSDPPQSVVVSSGTGSGKTECFLVPILDSLARQRIAGQPLVGVQALFLYPLNALINSQRDRLRAWTGGFGGDIRFCLYNGQTPHTDPRGDATRRAPQQVGGRPTLRKQPPPILITNSTMLEYMLVRAEDAPIIDQSKGKLRWIVLDEAHTYVGSQAAEIALLLRRVLHAFDARPADVRFVATSATIGTTGDQKARKQLREYLAGIAGVPRDRVHVIEGARNVPKLPKTLTRQSAPVPTQPELVAMTAEARYEALAATREVRELRSMLSQKPHTIDALTRGVFDRAEPEDVKRTLELLDIARTAMYEGTPLLPLRGHVFHRTQPGMWSCSDPHCGDRQPELEAGWPYGAVHLERRTHCGCGALVYELLMCRRCGAEYLCAEEDNRPGEGDFVLPTDPNAADEETLLDSDDEPDEDDVHPAGRTPTTPHRLLWRRDNGRTDGQLHDIELRSGKLVAGDAFCVTERPEGGARCPRCGEHEIAAGELLRPMRLGASFFLGVSIPALLEHAPEDAQWPKDRPFSGRRTITFSDSRQGTARFALKSQLEAERMLVRSQIYHKVQSRIPPAGDRDGEIEELRKNEAILASGQLDSLPDVAAMLERKVAELRGRLTTNPVGVVGWREMVRWLAESNAVRRWIEPWWRARGRDAGELAEFLLVREVARRPMRQNSVETLGLAAVDYPKLSGIVDGGLPRPVQAEGLSANDWRAFLKLLLDLVMRGNTAVNIDRDALRWMGTKIVPRFILGPDATSPDPKARQRLWPYLRSGKAPTRVIKLLARGLGLHLDDPEQRARLNDVLREAWNELTKAQVLEQGDGGFRLDFGRSAVLTSVGSAWVCPITRRVLDTTFRDHTPYLARRPDAPSTCEKIEMPRLRYPFPENGDASGRPIDVDDVIAWLEEDPRVCEARRRGVWTEFSDRLATFARFFRVEEHSAQQTGAKLSMIEGQFKEGYVNVLSCSTTMEMGVDIGGLAAVAMNNAPPGPSNFLQRAGRAGRRGETAAVSLTMCQAAPHGEAVFKEPLWPFETPIHVPRVTLESERIVQRHINAMALTHFLAAEGSNALKLRAGAFVERSGEADAPADRFGAWLRDPARTADGSLRMGINQLVAESTLEGLTIARLLAQSATRLEDILRPWREELSRLVKELDEAGGPPPRRGSATPAQLAVDRQLRRLRGEYLLGELANRGFLPGYGFPTGVVPFINTTIEDLRREEERKKRQRDDDDDEAEHTREDGPSRGRGWPTRELAKAIREYAPGNDVVVDGAVYRSDGVTLNWQVPPTDQPWPDLQAFRYAWRCNGCAATGTSIGRPDACEGCGSPAVKYRRYLQPSGFAVSIVCQPHNDLSRGAYVPVNAPWVSVGTEPWTPLARPELGRMRSTSDGFLFHHSLGEAGHGYAICLVCGRAGSEVAPAREDPKLPTQLIEHRKLRGGKDKDGSTLCPANDRTHSTMRHQALGSSERTDVFELQLAEIPTGRIVKDPVVLSTVAVALRQAAAEELGIEERELGWAVIPSRAPSGDAGLSIALYDTAAGGAGFVGAIPERLATLLRSARNKLDCPRRCDAACHACLLSYDTQHHVDVLDRNKGEALLSDTFLQALELDPRHRYFGDASRSEYQPLPQALRREARHQHVTKVRLVLGGEPASWDLSAWEMRTPFLAWAANGIEIELGVAPGVIDAIDEANRAALASLVEASVVSVRELDSLLQPRQIVAEVWGREAVRWASEGGEARAPGPDWGVSSVVLVRSRAHQALEEWTGPLIGVAELRPAPPVGGNFHGVAIERQLAGDIRRFGHNLWRLVFEKVPQLQQRLAGGQSIQKISYTDRYLRSPLTVRLLVEVVAYLRASFPAALAERTPVEITTMRLERTNRRRPTLTGDWDDSRDRKEVLRMTLAEHGLSAAVTEVDRQQVAHHRGLTVTWNDGSSWRLRLDEGFGFLSDGRHPTNFPFHLKPDRQSQALLKATPHIDRRANLPSQIYVEHLR